MGREIGQMIRAVHEAHGVEFHLGRALTRIDAKAVTLDDGTALPADLVVVGIGVTPRVALAEGAGLTVDRGIVVDEYLATSAADVFAAGDVARWPDRRTGQGIRVEHWVVAERQGQTAVRNMLGAREKFESAPFFWSAHYDVVISYVGHAERWEATYVVGDLSAHDASVRFCAGGGGGGRSLAVASIGQDRKNLEAEVALERDDEVALGRIVPAGSA
jgi:3-phenylpropionate/trans-cinnamate dioxygenase ferredoxin reductase subunit